MLQYLRNKGIIKPREMFIKEDEKVKTKFGNVAGNSNSKEIARSSNYNS